MIQSGDVSDRHTIPRWNSFDTAVALGETAPVEFRGGGSAISTESVEHLQSLLHTWNTERSLPLAIEIISTARFSSAEADISEVTDYALKAVGQMERAPALLKDALGLTDDGIMAANDICCHSITHKSIATLKKSLSQFPRNPLDWCELAREYLILGHTEKSERALHVALELAPENRTILRSAAQFYAHINNPEKGLYYLRGSSVVRHDPWVLSSEIALSNEIDRRSKLVKLGQQMIEDTNINPGALSELASELGTMDFVAANNRRGKRKLEIAKIVPHENSVAQMAWINQRVCNIEQIILDMKEPKCNFEAESRRSMAQEDWASAIGVILNWQDYQPFSRAPAMDGSYIATDFLNDPNLAISIARRGLISNPGDISLTNNYIYALIMAGNLSAASDALQCIGPPSAEGEDNIPLIATNGLFCYRSGFFDEGRRLYQIAIDCANRLNRPDIAYRVQIYLAREAKMHGEDITQLIAQINSDRNKIYLPSCRSLIENFNLA